MLVFVVAQLVAVYSDRSGNRCFTWNIACREGNAGTMGEMNAKAGLIKCTLITLGCMSGSEHSCRPGVMNIQVMIGDGRLIACNIGG